jgi:hypothetical protein
MFYRCPEHHRKKAAAIAQKLIEDAHDLVHELMENGREEFDDYIDMGLVAGNSYRAG